MENIKKNLAQIRNNIANLEKKYHRHPNSVTLVAVAKSQPITKIRTANAVAQKDFGESYLQEAIIKINELKELDIVWHYIGRIQSKKAKLIAPNFAWVESVASYEIAELLNKYRPPNMSLLNICLQINISKEVSKAGILPEEILPLAQKISTLPRLKLRGLMTIPAPQKEFTKQLSVFKELAQEFKKLQEHGLAIDTLSMGMSDDYEAAIAAGATIIRVGTSIFGNR